MKQTISILSMFILSACSSPQVETSIKDENGAVPLQKKIQPASLISPDAETLSLELGTLTNTGLVVWGSMPPLDPCVTFTWEMRTTSNDFLSLTFTIPQGLPLEGSTLPETRCNGETQRGRVSLLRSDGYWIGNLVAIESFRILTGEGKNTGWAEFVVNDVLLHRGDPEQIEVAPSGEDPLRLRVSAKLPWGISCVGESSLGGTYVCSPEGTTWERPVVSSYSSQEGFSCAYGEPRPPTGGYALVCPNDVPLPKKVPVGVNEK